MILANFESSLKVCFSYYIALGHKILNISTWKLKGELICYFLHLTDVHSFIGPLWFIILKLQNGCSWCSVKVAKRIAYSCAWIVLKKPSIQWFYLFLPRCSLAAWANYDFFFVSNIMYAKEYLELMVYTRQLNCNLWAEMHLMLSTSCVYYLTLIFSFSICFSDLWLSTWCPSLSKLRAHSTWDQLPKGGISHIKEIEKGLNMLMELPPAVKMSHFPSWRLPKIKAVSILRTTIYVNSISQQNLRRIWRAVFLCQVL